MISSFQRIRAIVGAALFAALTGVGAWISLPLGVVPITLQSLFVNLAALLLGPRYAALAMTIYLVMGTLGLPVLAGGGSGIGVVVGPSGGFLFGFIAGAFVASSIVDGHRRRADEIARTRLLLVAAIALVVGSAIIFSMGAVWGKLSTGLSWSAILAGWVLPFLPGDILKAAVAAVLAVEIWRRKVIVEQRGL